MNHNKSYLETTWYFSMFFVTYHFHNLFLNNMINKFSRNNFLAIFPMTFHRCMWLSSDRQEGFGRRGTTRLEGWSICAGIGSGYGHYMFRFGYRYGTRGYFTSIKRGIISPHLYPPGNYHNIPCQPALLSRWFSFPVWWHMDSFPGGYMFR